MPIDGQNIILIKEKDEKKNEDEETKEDDLVSRITDWARTTVKYMEDYIYPSAVKSYEDIQLFMGRRKLENTKSGFGWSSNEKYPLIANARRTYSGLLSRLDLKKVTASTYLNDVDDEVKKGLPIYEKQAKYFLNKPETKQAGKQIIDEALATGSAYGRVAWKNVKVKIVDKVSKGDTKNSRNVRYKEIDVGYPVLKYCSFFDVVRDITSDKTIGERYFATRTDIEDEYTIDEDTREEIDKGESGTLFSFDYNKVKNIDAWSEEIESKCKEVCEAQGNKNSNRKSLAKKLPSTDNFYRLNENDGLYEVFDVDIEDGDDTINVVMVNGVVVYSGKSQEAYPGPKIICLIHKPMPGEKFGWGIGKLGRGYQSTADTLYNSYLNNIKILSNPMFTKEESLLDDNSNVFTYEPWGIASEGSGAFTFERIGLVDGSDTQNNLNAIQVIESKFNNDLGLNPYVTGGSGGIERSAAGVAERSKGTDNKIADFLENINTFFSTVVERMTLTQMVFGGNIYEKIDGEEIDLKADDIVTGYRITFDGDDILGSKAQRTQEAINLLSAVAPFNVNPVTGDPVIDSEKMLKNVFEGMDMYDVIPDKEKKLEKLNRDIEYVKERDKVLSSIQTPTSPFDRENVNVTLSSRELMQVPGLMEQVLGSIGLQVQQGQPVSDGEGPGIPPGAIDPGDIQPSDVGQQPIDEEEIGMDDFNLV